MLSNDRDERGKDPAEVSNDGQRQWDSDEGVGDAEQPTPKSLWNYVAIP